MPLPAHLIRGHGQFVVDGTFNVKLTGYTSPRLERARARFLATIPLGRLSQPQDIANACLYVASENASYMSGTNLLLHGGGERPAFLSASNSESVQQKH